MSTVDVSNRKRKTSNADETNEVQEIVTNDLTIGGSSTKICAYFVHRKKRFCKMTVAANQEYCGQHLPAAPIPLKRTTATNVNENSNAEIVMERIPCPLDAKHTIYKKNLRKHLKICNARQKDDLPAYIVPNINTDAPLTEISPEAAPATKEDDYSKIKLNELDDAEFYDIVKKVKTLYEKCFPNELEILNYQHNLLAEELAKSSYGIETKKHLQQTAALLGILEHEQQLVDATSFIEFGAGKGQLAFYLAKLFEQQKTSQVILLDRMSLRHKKDNKIEDRSLVQRIRADISDFQMSALDLLHKTKRNVAFSKHLCGGATDLTLRCITQAAAAGTVTEFILIALCCHHRCDWRSFVGKKFFEIENITPRQFMIITKMVGWAICGTGMSRERRKNLEAQSLSPQEVAEIIATQQQQRLTLSERTSVGFMCKRILDFARLEYLKDNGYDATLKCYVTRDVTLENVCLLANRRKN